MSFAEGISYFVYGHFSVVVFSPTFCTLIFTDICDTVHDTVAECQTIIDTPAINKEK